MGAGRKSTDPAGPNLTKLETGTPRLPPTRSRPMEEEIAADDLFLDAAADHHPAGFSSSSSSYFASFSEVVEEEDEERHPHHHHRLLDDDAAGFDHDETLAAPAPAPGSPFSFASDPDPDPDIDLELRLSSRSPPFWDCLEDDLADEEMVGGGFEWEEIADAAVPAPGAVAAGGGGGGGGGDGGLVGDGDVFGFLDEREILGAMEGLNSGDDESGFSDEPFDFGDEGDDIGDIFRSVGWRCSGAAGRGRLRGAAGARRGRRGGGRPARAAVERAPGGGGRRRREEAAAASRVAPCARTDRAGGARHAAAVRALVPRGVHRAVARHPELVSGVPLRAAHR